MDSKAQTKKPISEPPKFKLEDVPEPPKLEMPESESNLEIPEEREMEMDVPEPVHSENAEQDIIPPPPPKKSFLGKLKSEENPPAPEFEEEKIEIPQYEESEFAPSGSGEESPDESIKRLQQEISEPSLTEQLSEEYPQDSAVEGPEWYTEAQDYQYKEMEDEAKAFIALEAVKGVGKKRASALKKAGIKSAEHLSKQKHKDLAKKVKISDAHAKKIITHAKKLTKLKEKLKRPKKESVKDIIKNLEQERKLVEELEQKGRIDEQKIIDLEGHKDLVEVIEKLEKRRAELVELERHIAEKEIKLGAHEETHHRDLEHLDNLKRRFDYDMRERNKYLINIEKDYFQKAQLLAKKQTDIEVKDQALEQQERLAKEREAMIKEKLNDLEDRELTIQTKEKKFEKLMQELEKQDQMLNEKEDDLLKREAEYIKKIDALEDHESHILERLQDERERLEAKEKELEMRELRMAKQEKYIDKKSVALEYARDIVSKEKDNLLDAEFQQYLNEQLTNVKSNVLHDMDIVQNVPIDVEPQKKSIYQLIELCKDMLRNNRTTEAKIFYNEIREKYYDSRFGNEKEKEAVHDMIRALYDEINLADIGRNR